MLRNRIFRRRYSEINCYYQNSGKPVITVLPLFFLPGIYTACMFRSNAARAIKEKLEMMKGKAENCAINLGNYFLFTIEHTFAKL